MDNYDGIYIMELDKYCYIDEQGYKLLQDLQLVEAWYYNTWDNNTKYNYYKLLGYSKEEIDELF